MLGDRLTSRALAAWLAVEKWRWRRKPVVPLWEKRRELIRQLAPGRSFIDLGGMWGIHGEVAFLAEEAGATRVVLCDGMDPSEEFQRKHEQRSSSVKYAQRDLHDTDGIESLGAFDVVWCAGIIYHSPNPYLQLENLRRITRQTLLLGTHVIPEVPAFPQACLWYPGLSAQAREAFARAHGEEGRKLWGVATPFDYTPALGYANFWWGITPSALRSMLEVAGFEVTGEHPIGPFFTDVLACPIERESVIPPPDFARRRDKERHAAFGAERPAWA